MLLRSRVTRAAEWRQIILFACFDDTRAGPDEARIVERKIQPTILPDSMPDQVLDVRFAFL